MSRWCQKWKHFRQSPDEVANCLFFQPFHRIFTIPKFISQSSDVLNPCLLELLKSIITSSSAISLHVTSWDNALSKRVAIDIKSWFSPNFIWRFSRYHHWGCILYPLQCQYPCYSYRFLTLLKHSIHLQLLDTLW